MKNLGNYGVQELSIKEMKETDGGVWWLILAIVIVAAIFAADGNPNTQTYIDGERVGN